MVESIDEYRIIADPQESTCQKLYTVLSKKGTEGVEKSPRRAQVGDHLLTVESTVARKAILESLTYRTFLASTSTLSLAGD